MVASCAAYNCSNRASKSSGLSFFSFPLGNPQLLRKWIKAIKRDNFCPSKNSRLCSVHFTEDSYQIRPGAAHPLLRSNAVPSIFNFSPPKRIRKICNEMPTRCKQLVISSESAEHAGTSDVSESGAEETEDNGQTLSGVESIKDVVAVDHCYYGTLPREQDSKNGCDFEGDVLPSTDGDLTYGESAATKVSLRKKIKVLQQKVRRQNRRIQKLRRCLEQSKKSVSDLSIDILKSSLSTVPRELFENEVRNKSTGRVGHRYSDTIKEFAITLCILSPSAYDYVRTIFTLPHPSLIKKWTSVQCEGDFILEDDKLDSMSTIAETES